MKITTFAALTFLLLVTKIDGADDPWKPLQFMIGDWVGTGSGKPGQGGGEFSLRPDLANKILVRHNHSEYPARPGQSQGVVHDDLMIIYLPQGSGAFRAEYFDSEGHVIHYVISFSEDKAVFLSDAPTSSPRFRLTYQKKSENELGIDFAIAPPNQDFHPYLSGTVTRK